MLLRRGIQRLNLVNCMFFFHSNLPLLQKDSLITFTFILALLFSVSSTVYKVVKDSDVRIIRRKMSDSEMIKLNYFLLVSTCERLSVKQVLAAVVEILVQKSQFTLNWDLVPSLPPSPPN